MTSATSGEVIQSEMREIRNSLRSDVNEVVNNVSIILDWRYQFQSRPWLWCGIALAAGYFIVPRRTNASELGSVVLDKLGDSHPIIVIGNGNPKRGLFGEVMHLLGNAAAREVASHGREFGARFLDQLLNSHKGNTEQEIT
jgi:hypothetical protein